MGLQKVFKEVKSEVRKIAFPSPKETLIITLVVIVVVMFSGFFFVVVDYVIYRLLSILLGLGG